MPATNPNPFGFQMLSANGSVWDSATQRAETLPPLQTPFRVPRMGPCSTEWFAVFSCGDKEGQFAAAERRIVDFLVSTRRGRSSLVFSAPRTRQLSTLAFRRIRMKWVVTPKGTFLSLRGKAMKGKRQKSSSVLLELHESVCQYIVDCALALGYQYTVYYRRGHITSF